MCYHVMYSLALDGEEIAAASRFHPERISGKTSRSFLTSDVIGRDLLHMRNAGGGSASLPVLYSVPMPEIQTNVTRER